VPLLNPAGVPLLPKMTAAARSNVVKLFVGQIPKTLEEDGVREGTRAQLRLACAQRVHD